MLTSKSALEGERKQVTVLFADLKDSMQLLARRDAEEARRILDPVLALMMEAVHDYGGTVNQVQGDGIMALFGAPLALEDHAVRACLAALRMQERARRIAGELGHSSNTPIRIRVGLNSGEVLVRSIGSDLHMDYTAVGQTTHLAARMEQMAEPGTILATAETVRLAEGYVEALPLGERAVRGLDTPVPVHVITGPGAARRRLEVAAARGLTRFVGRDAELALLGRAVAEAANGRGQVVAVVGEPGVGKSRLFHEITRAERMPDWVVLKAGAFSYGQATAYLPVIELLGSLLGVDRHADIKDVRQVITARLAAVGEDVASIRPPLLALFDVPVDDRSWHELDTRRRGQQTIDAIRRLLLHTAKTQPLCVVLEDLHWIDSETQAVLDTLVDSLPAARLLLLVNYRPEYRHTWGNKSYYAQLRIDPLPRHDAAALLSLLLGDDPQLAALKSLLVERTEGNPFFLEESVRTLVEDGVLVGTPGTYRLERPVERIRLPATVQAVLAARIDRLEAEDKRLLQCASVIGENVALRLLSAVAEMSEGELLHRLARLRAAEFLYDINVLPDCEYVFRHGLTCRVAYDSLVRERRRLLHARTAEAIERLYPDRLGEHVEVLANHARRGELWERAARYLRQAGTKAFGRSANREAVTWLTQALEILPRVDETSDVQADAADVHLSLRNALTLLGEHARALAHLREAATIAERAGDARRLGRALSFQVNSLLLLGEHQEAIDVARRARAVAEDLGDVALRIVTDMYAGRAHLYVGEFARAIEIFERVVAELVGPLMHDHLGIPVLPSVFARSHLAECLAEVGRFDESAHHAADAVTLAETGNHPDTLLWAYHAVGAHHLIRGEVRPATDAFERAYALCRTHDMPTYRPRIGSELALAWALGGRATEAVPIVEQAATEASSRQQSASSAQVLLLLGEVYLLADRPSDAADAATRALERLSAQRARGHTAYALRLLADIDARGTADDRARAERRYGEASALAESLGMLPLRARCDIGRARLLIVGGHPDRARPFLQSACAQFRALGMSADLARAERELQVVG
jgi:class 3 adenylate cyclase/tetratricopeptide (TPR) repeat protein